VCVPNSPSYGTDINRAKLSCGYQNVTVGPFTGFPAPVQNWPMPILVELRPNRRKKAVTDAEWYLNPTALARHEELFLETYFDPPEPSILLLKCEHGVYLGDQIRGYCTVCTDYWVSGPRGMGHSEKRLRGQTSLCKGFPRRGFVSVLCQVLPPLDQRLKMRTDEAVGGYVRKGIAVRAQKGYAPKTNEKTGAEGFTRITTNRLPISLASLPNPVRSLRAWTYPDDERFFEYVAVYRNEYKTVAPPAYDFPQPIITYFGRQEYGGFRLLSERLPNARQRAKDKADDNQKNECSELSGIDWKNWTPPDYEPTEKQIRMWRWNHWSKRTPYDPTAGNREPLKLTEETRTDRETRARLKVKWGGRWRPKEMHKRVWEELHAVRLRVDASGTRPYYWPEYELEGAARQGGKKPADYLARQERAYGFHVHIKRGVSYPECTCRVTKDRK